MGKNSNDWKDRLGVVYSTNANFSYESEEEEEPATLPANQQRLRTRIEKNHRGGKVVTIVAGFTGSEEDLKAIGKMLKTKCGTGGSVKENEIIIQGDVKEKVVALLKAAGYSQTK